MTFLHRAIFHRCTALVAAFALAACGGGDAEPVADGASSAPEAPSAGADGDANASAADGPVNILILLTDDQSYPHASAYGDTLVTTPGFDRIAREGVLFDHAFNSTPSCGPSRATLLTGLPFYRLGDASMNHSVWQEGLVSIADAFADEGYLVGYTGKGWAPGNWEVTSRTVSPIGVPFNDARLESPPGKQVSPLDYDGNFADFLAARENSDQPFFFFVGIDEPHRPYDPGIGAENGVSVDAKDVPAFLPDAPMVRTDLEDYAFEIEFADAQVEDILDRLDAEGLADNTLVIMTADNGMPFPRAKAQVYDSGARVPFAIRGPGVENPGRRVSDFISFIDIAPTLADIAGVAFDEPMVGESLTPLLQSAESGDVAPGREQVVIGVERHFPGARPDGAGYPIRALRTEDFLYIRNLTPAASASGDHPGLVWPTDDPVGGFGDIDGGLAKTYLWENREAHPELAAKAFGAKPAEELYDLRADPDQLNNVAEDGAYTDDLARLRAALDARLSATGDPRAVGEGAMFDDIMRRFPVMGANGRQEYIGPADESSFTPE